MTISEVPATLHGRRPGPTTRSRSMLPREHGAYAELALPLVAALAASRPTVASGLYAIAACAAFVAHEPALVLLGHRGSRATRESSAAARRWLAWTLGIAFAFGAAAFALSSAARASMLVPAAFALIAAALVVRREERSLVGELVASVALASAAVPAAALGGIDFRDALALSGVFSAAFFLSTVEVRAVARREARPLARLATWTASLAILALVALARPLLALAPLPMLAVIAYIAVRAPAPTALRRLGWVLVASSVATTAVAVIALRA